MQGIVYVKDKPSNVFAVQKWVKKIRKNLAEAVWLKVQILDVTLNNSTQAGINWNAVFNSAFKANPAGLSAVTIGANLATGAGIASGAPSVEFANSAGTNSAILEALKTQGNVNILSEPTLIVPNGETGVINSSSISNYIQTVESISTGLTSSQTYPVIAQVSAGLSTAFTPHIDKKNGMVTVVINFLDNNITGYNDFTVSGTSFDEPIIQSKTLSDIIRVRNNHTVIMGGIITTNDNKENYGVPLLSDIPILGLLFQGTNDTYEKDDLIMMITPKIIKY
jgi:type II secretory pathway component GspD/PulD (secretin)